jgi:hypothetical protein
LTARRSDVQLAPDFAALGAFAVNLPDGTPIQDEDYPGVRYETRGGRIVPMVDTEAVLKIDQALAKERSGPAPAPADGAANLAAPPVAAPALAPPATAEPRVVGRKWWAWGLPVGVTALAGVAALLLWHARRNRAPA